MRSLRCNNDAARNCGDLVVARPDDDNGEGREAPGTSAGSDVSTVDFEKPALPLAEQTKDEKIMSREQGEATGEVDGTEEGVLREAANDGRNEEDHDMDVEMEGVDNSHGNEGQTMNDQDKGVDACADRGEADEGTGQSENNTGSLPTAGLASRVENGAMAESEGDRELRGEEDELDPLTGIPLRWARFWKNANANQSIWGRCSRAA